jgi:hypothetical protein
MISMGVLVWVFGASPLQPALCHQDGSPSDPHFEMHDLVAGKLTEGECSEARRVSGTVTRVERNRKSKMVTAFRVRSDDGKDWTFDALKLKDNMRANVKDEFDAGIAKGNQSAPSGNTSKSEGNSS